MMDGLDPYNFRHRLIKAIEEDYYFNPESYSTEYADGINMVCDAITKITGLKFPKYHANWDIM